MMSRALPVLVVLSSLSVATTLHANALIDLHSDPKVRSCASHASGEWRISAAAVSIEPDGAYVYQAGFDPTSWSGTLQKRSLASDTSGSTTISSALLWDAGTVLDQTVAREGHTFRQIYTSRQDGGVLRTIPFTWDALSSDQQRQLHRSPATAEEDQAGSARVAYLRGDRAKEINKGGMFRHRRNLLGDIVNSAPVIVGQPATLQWNGESVTRFHQPSSQRRTVFVGANDGMMHAFDAENGKELFAYVPNAVIEHLPILTYAPYPRRAYVDGAMTAAEVSVGGASLTVLAASLGGGAQGVFALDVTNPDNFVRGRGVLWEFTDRDDAAFGNVFGAPLIVKLRSDAVKGRVQHRYFVMVAGGVNSSANDGHAIAAAPAALFLLALDKPGAQRWQEGVNYFRYWIAADEQGLANGLSAVAPVLGSDGSLMHAYAGDLQGNVWRFDFNGDVPKAGKLSPRRIFLAKDNRGRRQPITQRFGVVRAPGGYLVLFGTGKFLEADDLDPGAFATQTIYGVLDRNGQSSSDRSQLVERVVQRRTDSSVLTITGSRLDFNGNRRGWYVDLIDSAQTGERSISNVQIVGTQVYVETLIPAIDPCRTNMSRSYVLETLTGLPATADLSGYLAPAVSINPVPMLLPTSPREVGVRDATGKRKVRSRTKVVRVGDDGSAADGAHASPRVIEQTTTAGRLSWREIVNWTEKRSTR